jgi:xanthine dehydrogenase YagR molybdenum-binding subunit
VQVAEMDMLANTFMRAPGEAVGTFALESAIDELAGQLGLDPVELRIRNEPESDRTSGKPFPERHLVEAYRAGAERFGWDQRNPEPPSRDGQGTATAQPQVAAERLGLPLDRVTFAYGESSSPCAVLAGGSQQTASRVSNRFERRGLAWRSTLRRAPWMHHQAAVSARNRTRSHSCAPSWAWLA